MKLFFASLIVLSIMTVMLDDSFAEKSTFFDSVKFIQYIDENTALEEVRNGNLDIYYYRIPSDRLESSQSRQGLQVFDSAGGSYSFLLNPAETTEFNPFSIKEIRFALNYLIDRKLIVNELMAGHGAPMISYYGPSDPEYLSIINQLEKFNFRYNPTLANEIISDVLIEKGAIKSNNQWQINEKPITITIIIRSDDPVRKSIGEILSSELEKIGFVVKKDFGDLNKAFVVVYGSDPGEAKWHIYTEGWARSAFVKYDSIGLGQMYSPWFSNMPGFNDPTYWNYENEKIDSMTQKIYTGDFESSEQRTKLIQDAILEGISESVRIFIASKNDQYIANEKIKGIVNDFGAGVPSRFTPINSRSDSNELVIGVKQIYQGSWNPVMGLSDAYSRHIWGIISDPITFKHPFTGETLPIRTELNVVTAGPNEKLNLPPSAIIWDPTLQEWKKIDEETQSISKVTFDLKFNNWHNGQKMDMNDILHSLYFTIEWGTQIDEKDKTFDTEFTPRASQMVETIKGINIIDENTLEVYVDYWHFDDGEIADWASLWSSMPWEISSAMEQAVIDGKVSFSRSGAISKNVNWLSLIIPKDANLIKDYLKEFQENGFKPISIIEHEKGTNYFENRYDASIKWIEKNNQAIISNGPYYLEAYYPESRTIVVNAFDDESYPFKLGQWSEFEETNFPTIKNVEMNSNIKRGTDFEANIETTETDSILYFLTNTEGKIVLSEQINVDQDSIKLKIPSEKTNELGIGANDLKVFAISESVLKPDYYANSFFVSENYDSLPVVDSNNVEFAKSSEEGIVLWAIPVIVIIGIIIYAKKIK